MHRPRHLRFARAVALVSGLSACGGASAPARAPSPARPPTVVAADPCASCVCHGSVNPPSCYTNGHGACCDSVVEGPLPPPDLPA